ncbi:MAG: hypothetical protein CVT89_07200 [Candidatus Altiarchaeales archaeon HGW-Altiarchaeales-2]|nr:MAG: hypothetical protein CVT89_07200 [Candidatus Altiarchaeales archaeon HGW-Altiarchaeales-2]
MTDIIYPTKDRIIEFNFLVLNLIKVKKADTAKVLSHFSISKTIEDCKDYEGDLYDKGAVLMRKIVKGHAFASGNRRTAFITTKYFIKENKGNFKIKDDPDYARVMVGIRENYYSHDEIRNWIKTGKIRAFKR